ncbi:MAG: hypothetical protein QW702_08775 [Candidatus Bathyarchaeia archaeon]
MKNKILDGKLNYIALLSLIFTMTFLTIYGSTFQYCPSCQQSSYCPYCGSGGISLAQSIPQQDISYRYAYDFNVDCDYRKANDFTIIQGTWLCVCEGFPSNWALQGSANGDTSGVHTIVLTKVVNNKNPYYLTDYEIRWAMKTTYAGVLNDEVATLLFRYKDASNYYLLKLQKDGTWLLQRKKMGSITTLATIKTNNNPLNWHDMVLRIQGTTTALIIVERYNINENFGSRMPIIAIYDTSPIDRGTVGFQAYYCEARFDNLEVFEYRTPLRAEWGSIFHPELDGDTGWYKYVSSSSSSIGIVSDGNEYRLELNGYCGKASIYSNAGARNLNTGFTGDPNIYKEIDISFWMQTKTSYLSGQVGEFYFSYTDLNNYFMVKMLPDGKIQLWKRKSGTLRLLCEGASIKSPYDPHTFRISRKGINIVIWVDGEWYINRTVSDVDLDGGLIMFNADNCKIWVDNVIVRDHSKRSYMPYWEDQSFDQGLCSNGGKWKELMHDVQKKAILWLSENGDYFVRLRVGHNAWAGTSVYQGILNSGDGLSCQPSFYGKCGSEILPKEAIIYYDDVLSGKLKMYLNLDIRLVNRSDYTCSTIECTGLLPTQPKTNIGLVFLAYADESGKYQQGLAGAVKYPPFESYNAPHPRIDVFFTIEPQFYSTGAGGVEAGADPTTCSPYGDSSYHFFRQKKPKTGWQFGERLRFTLNLTQFIKEAFEFDWFLSSVYSVCCFYGLPAPKSLTWQTYAYPFCYRRTGIPLKTLIDHVHIYAVYPYVEACCGDITADFFEISITTTPKYQLIGG